MAENVTEKLLKTRIQLRYDSLENWTSKNPDLKKGEVAIAYLPPKVEGKVPDAVPETASAVLMKVGPGQFNALPWMSALAADVYEWAKKNEVKIAVENEGNAITGAEIKDGFLTFTKGTKFATKAELDAAVEAFGGDLSAITDNDHRYSFAITEGKLVITAVNYVNGEAGESAPVASLDFVAPDELTNVLTNYYTKEEADAKFVAKGDINTKDSAGLVAKGSEGISNTGSRGMVWGTDKEGNPGWKDPIIDGLIALAPQTTGGVTWASYEDHELSASARGQVYINHAEVAGTAKNAATLEDKTLGLGEKIAVFEPLYDKYGHIKSTEKVEFTLPTATDVAGVKVDNAGHADTAGNATHAETAGSADQAAVATKTVAPLTVVIGGETKNHFGDTQTSIDVDAAVAAGVAEAKKYADDNDANTEYHVEYDSANKKIKLVAGADASKMEIPTDDFIKDGMIQSVEIKDNNLVITWNADAENNVTNIPLTELVDVMTGVDGTTIKVDVSADDKISAEVKTGSLKDGHIASDAAIAKGKLATDVQTSLGKADTAVQPGDIGTMAAENAADYTKIGTMDDVNGQLTAWGLMNKILTKADRVTGATAGNFAGLDENGNLTDSGKKAADFEVAGAAAAVKEELIGHPSDQGTQGALTLYGIKQYVEFAAGFEGEAAKNYADSLASNYATSAQGDKADTAVQTITPVAGNGLKATKTGTDVSLDWDETITFVFNCGDASGNPLA